MSRKEKAQKVFLYGVFICYIIFLIKLLFLSRISFYELLNSKRSIDRSINLIPFYSIKEYIFSNPETIKRFAFSNIVGNIIIFIPLGTYFLLFRKEKRIALNLLLIFIISLFVEIIQGILGIGASDIDDVILNCLGGLVGICIYKFLMFVLKSERKVFLVITIVSLLGLPILLYLLLFIKLRL